MSESGENRAPDFAPTPEQLPMVGPIPNGRPEMLLKFSHELRAVCDRYAKEFDIGWYEMIAGVELLAFKLKYECWEGESVTAKPDDDGDDWKRPTKVG
jgi:hypothetical protein